MLHEDQQVGRPVLQLIYVVEAWALVIDHLKERENTQIEPRDTQNRKEK